ncbi:MAG: N-formylglutamate amidohydrolase [Alphaproteobacteria bacterium]
MQNLAAQDLALLGPDDPAPFSVENPNGAAAILLVCDHASNAVPAALHGLGLTERELHLHIAHDKGASMVTRLLAQSLDAPAVLSGYSRLVIDCNRRPGHPSSILQVSDGIEISGNIDVGPAEAARRAEAFFWPYHRKIGTGIAGFALSGIKPAIISLHSFTPTMAGAPRPWEVGVLWDHDARMAGPLIEALSARGDLSVGDNLPYSGRQRFGYSVEVHATETGLPNVLIEMREDLVADDDGAGRMAAILTDALRPILADPQLYRTMRF